MAFFSDRQICQYFSHPPNISRYTVDDEDCDPFSDLPVDKYNLSVSLPDHPIQLDSDEETEVETAEDDSGSMDEYEIGDPDSFGC